MGKDKRKKIERSENFKEAKIAALTLSLEASRRDLMAKEADYVLLKKENDDLKQQLQTCENEVDCLQTTLHETQRDLESAEKKIMFGDALVTEQPPPSPVAPSNLSEEKA